MPTIAGATPPPDCPNTACDFVKKSQEKAAAPRLSTAQTTSTSTETASTAASVASTARIFSVRFRRRRRFEASRLIGSSRHYSTPRFSARRITTCAAPFVTRARMRRIKAR